MMSMNLNDIVSFSIHSIDYRCLVNRISKSEAVNLLQNADLRKKVKLYKLQNFFIYIQNE